MLLLLAIIRMCRNIVQGESLVARMIDDFVRGFLNIFLRIFQQWFVFFEGFYEQIYYMFLLDFFYKNKFDDIFFVYVYIIYIYFEYK